MLKQNTKGFKKGEQFMRNLMTEPAETISFMLAGNSTLTLKSTVSQKHYTYKVRKPRSGNTQMRFVSCLFSDDAYQYIGSIFPDSGAGAAHFVHTKGSKCSPEAISFKAFKWTFDRILRMQMPEGLEVWHEGRCGKCGRKLTQPDSIKCGLGPICRGKNNA